MKGLDLAREYFEEFGRPMLEADFADILPFLAVGFVGSGSDRYGFDDEVSQDHDFEPGFCIFVPGEDVIDRRRAFQLTRAYAKLPREYKGFVRQPLSPVGGNRNGVIEISEFYGKAVGAPDGNLTLEQWLKLPDYALAEAVNGEVFFDNYGEFTRIRQNLLNMPQDIWLKRLSGNLLLMAQSGQYNFTRCLKHGEVEAAQFACNEFVNSAIKAVFLLNRAYMPYYKWSFRGLSQLPCGETFKDNLSLIILESHLDETSAKKKAMAIEQVASDVIALLQEQNLTAAICTDLEKHAYSVNDGISDGVLRNMHILAAV